MQEPNRFWTTIASNAPMVLDPKAAETACGHVTAYCGGSFDACMLKAQESARHFSGIDATIVTQPEVEACIAVQTDLESRRRNTHAMCQRMHTCLPVSAQRETNQNANARL